MRRAAVGGVYKAFKGLKALVNEAACDCALVLLERQSDMAIGYVGNTNLHNIDRPFEREPIGFSEKAKTLRCIEAVAQPMELLFGFRCETRPRPLRVRLLRSGPCPLQS